VYKTVEHSLTDYIERQYQDWQEVMERVFRGGEDIMNMNLVRRDSVTQLLEVTFPPEVAVLFKEVEGWERVGYSIPFVAMEHSKDKERISVVRWHVRAMVREYNTIISALEPWERKMFAEKLKALDRKIGPAVSRITWSNKGIVEFCRDARKLCTGSQGLVDNFKSHTTNVARCCREIANLPLVVIEHKKLYTAAEFQAVQVKHREHVVETLKNLSQDIKSSLKRIYKLFLGDGMESSREWTRFVERIDERTEKALGDGAKKSLTMLSKAINGDKKNESGQMPIFLVRVILDMSQQRVAYTPSPSELIYMINACAKDMTTMLDVVPRLQSLVEMEVRKEILDLEPDSVTLQREYEKMRVAYEASLTGDRMSKSISNDEDLTKVMIAITAGMSASGSQMAKTLGYWGKYEHIWEYNKDAQLKRFIGNRPGSNRKLESFEEEIKRYKDHHKQVSTEESHANMGFISVDYTTLKSDIVAHCIEWQRKYTGLLNQMALKDLNDILDAFQVEGLGFGFWGLGFGVLSLFSLLSLSLLSLSSRARALSLYLSIHLRFKDRV